METDTSSEEKLRPHLVTFPRSGLHYFDRIFYDKTQVHIENSHHVNWIYNKNNKKQRTVLTIARDPKDSIASYIAYEESKFQGFGWYMTDTRINQIVTEYILKYSFLYDNADYVIDFNDLINYPDAVIARLLDLLDIGKDNYHLFANSVGEEDPFFQESSKDLPFYDKNRLGDFNVDACYFYYNRLLEKKIVI